MHHRRSIRLQGYDYAQAGAYFVTICCQDRANLLGFIQNGVMQLNDAGQMVEKWYRELAHKFPHIQCGEMAIMPNHIHFIIIITSAVGADLRVSPINPDEPGEGEGEGEGEHIGSPQRGSPQRSPQRGSPQRGSPQRGSPQRLRPGEYVVETVGADLRVSPPNPDEPGEGEGEHVGSPQRSPQRGSPQRLRPGEHIGSPQQSPLYTVVQWFKTMTTNEYIRGVKTHNWQPFNKRVWQRNYYERIIRNEIAYQRIAQYIIDNPAKWDDDILGS